MQALRAAGQPFPFIQNGCAEGGETQGRQSKLRAFKAQGRESQKNAEDQADAHADGKCAQHAEPGQGYAKTGRIGSETQKSGLTQIHLAQISHGHIQSDQQNAVDGQQGQQPERVGIADRQGDGGKQHQHDDFRAPNK